VFGGNSICVHGYSIEVKERTLKRRTSLLKHARFLANMEVKPIFPADADEILPEEVAMEMEEEDN
jgi:hypothetical protein